MTTETTMPPEASAAEPRSVTPSGPGAQLRQARLDLKLAPEDVAGILHLSARQIVALENDDYANLPGPTYVRGYLRGYAQLLGLSAEPIVETYNRSVTARKPVDLGKLAPKPEIRSDHQLVKFATIGVVALILGLSAVWWQEQDEPATPETTQETPTTEPEISSPVTPPAAETGAQVESSTGPVVNLSDNGASTKPPVIAPAKPERLPVPAAPVVSAPATGTANAAAPIQQNITGPRGRLIMQATLDSWADVRDANGNRLLYEIIPAGRTVAIEGVLPLSVFLGNAASVHVEFNGEAYDTTKYRRGDIARFTLGDAAKAQ